MEEVDNIIIHSLQQIGCDIDERVTNLNKFDTEMVIDATVRCLEIIRPGLGASRILPANMAARFRVGATLAQACSELGYRGDIGYQTFLYSSETDLRKVFMFLIEKLPKESDKGTSEPISKIDQLEKSLSEVLSKELSNSWLPHYCRRKKSGGYTNMPYKSVELEVPSISDDPGFQDYFVRYLQSVPDQLREKESLLPSIISRNARLLNSRPTNILERLEWLNSQSEVEKTFDSRDERLMSRFTLNERLQSSKTKTDSEEERKTTASTPESPDIPTPTKEERQNQEIEKIKEECENLRIEVDNTQKEIKKLSTQLAQNVTKQRETEKSLETLQERRMVKSRTYNLLEDGENNLKKLETVIEAGRNKLLNLAHQWEKHRTPLIEKYRDERHKYSAKANTSQKKSEELRCLREKEKELIQECQSKDQQYVQLLAEVQKLPKETNRSAYTQRILEIIGNVRKQRDEIDKVLADTREIQKEINMLTGRLERSFTVVDELIFRDAKFNEASRRAYKLLATLHCDCSELVTLVEETGTTLREIRDLEEQIDSESTKNVGANLERITADLEQMRQETASLTAQLASKNS